MGSEMCIRDRDIVEHAVAAGKSCKVMLCNELETMGVNSRAELSKAELKKQFKGEAIAEFKEKDL